MTTKEDVDARHQAGHDGERRETFMPTSPPTRPRRTMLLTGASRGIGHATVIRFSSAGWRVLTCSRHPFPRNDFRSWPNAKTGDDQPRTSAAEPVEGSGLTDKSTRVMMISVRCPQKRIGVECR